MADLDDAAFRTAISARIADLGDEDALVIGYAVVAEVVTPGDPEPWLKTLSDRSSTTWAQIGRAHALRRQFEMNLDAGWSGDNDD